jgi:dynein heavy chain
LEDWILKEPAQIVLTLSQINFCKKVTQILMTEGSESKKRQFEDLKRKIERTLTTVASLVHNEEIWTPTLAKYKSKLIGSVLVNEVHHRDVLEMMINNRCESVEDFEWANQLR